MLTRVCLSLALLATTKAWSQIGVTPFEMPGTQGNDTRMQTPPPVSGEAYPTTVGSQKRSNYLSAGLTFTGGYDDNVLVGNNTSPIGDATYTILPTIALNQTTARQTLTLQYSPGFTFYQNTSELNSGSQSATLNFLYRPSRHTTISLGDSFQKSSSVLNQLSFLPGGTTTGSTQSSQAEAVAPYADRISNVANVVASYQFSRNGMIGASGSFAQNNYPNPEQAAGLSNSSSWGGSGFYNRRLFSNQYLGVTYQYSSSQSSPLNAQATPVDTQTNVHTQTILAFYTIYLNRSFSLSFSGGPQHYAATQTSSAPVSSWGPSAQASIGWQRSHTNFVASYSRTITGNTGLSGAFDASNANGSVSWQMARTWIAGLQGVLYDQQECYPVLFSIRPRRTFPLRNSFSAAPNWRTSQNRIWIRPLAPELWRRHGHIQ